MDGLADGLMSLYLRKCQFVVISLGLEGVGGCAWRGFEPTIWGYDA